jgi:hypothetical protein
MAFIVEIVVVLIIPFGLLCLVAMCFRPSWVRTHGGVMVAMLIASMFLSAFTAHELVITPCRATTNLHTVTTNLGDFYETTYKDSGEWCLWVRGNWPEGSHGNGSLDPDGNPD